MPESTCPPPTLTLHQGSAQREYVEHPIEIARRALLEAAKLESDEWASVMRRFASALPDRERITARGDR